MFDFAGFFSDIFASPVGWIIIGAVVFMIIALLSRRMHKIEQNNKQEWFIEPFKELVDNCEYYPNRYIDQNTYQGIGIIPCGDLYSGQDLLIGTYNDINFCYSEVESALRDHSKTLLNIKQKTVLFKGGIIMFDAVKNIRGSVSIIPKAGFYEKYELKKPREGEKIETDSVEFNDKFLIYSIYHDEAFYFLTPQAMEKIIKLFDGWSSKIAINISQGRISLIMPGLDLFNAAMRKIKDKAIIQDQIDKAVADFEELLDLIDIFSDIEQ